MWDMAALLTPAGRANLAAAGASLPAPPLPLNAHAAAASADARTGEHGTGTTRRLYKSTVSAFVLFQSSDVSRLSGRQLSAMRNIQARLLAFPNRFPS